MFFLENIYVNSQNELNNINIEISTEENISVSLESIALHYITLTINSLIYKILLNCRPGTSLVNDKTNT